MDDYEKIGESEKGLMEKILKIFPGYNGYRKKEILRETDRLVRDTLFNDLRKSKEHFQRYYRDLVSNGKPEAKDAERILMRIDSVSERIRHTTYGYASEMNVIKVKEDHIKRLIEFDQALAESVKMLHDNIDNLRNSEDGDIKKLLTNVDRIIVSLEENFSNRKNYMMNLSDI